MFFQKSFESITKRLSSMADDLMKHSERHSQASHASRVKASELVIEADTHAKEATRSAETAQRLKALVG